MQLTLHTMRRTSRSRRQAWANHDEAARQRRLRSLLVLFALYAVALLVLVTVSDGAYIGCILAGIAGHVLFASVRMFTWWRDAARLEQAKTRAFARQRLRSA